tara:strand:- start:2607 stop:4136 length:1530 start_codon:yes stop_codon:yes gene_type:complete
MAELNFGLLNPPGSQSFGNAFVQGMDQAQAARARDLQMQQSVRQNEVSQMQMAKMRRDEQGLAEFSRKVAAMGGPSDPIEIAKAYLAHPEVEMQKFGAGLMQKAQILAAYKLQFPDLAVAPSAPATGTTPANALAPPATGTTPATGTAPATGTTPANALAPPATGTTPAASTATVESRLAEIRTKLAKLEPFTGTNGVPAAIREADMLKKEAEGLLTPRTLAPGGTLIRAGLPDLTAPAAKSEFETLLGSSGLTDAEKTAARQARIGKESTTSYEFLTTLAQLGKTTDPYERGQLKNRLTQLSTHAPGTTVNVDTKVGNEYGKTFAKGIGEDDIKLRGAAIGAKDLAANANQTLKLLEDPKIFTGGAANIKLNLARALNVIGDTDAQAIANTEQLIRSTGKATLASIKNAGLGTGQGFTDKDLKMLQGVEGGTIELNADTLRAFATAQYNAATAIVRQWETRRKGIPAAALSGTGIDKETYPIEPKYSATPSDKPDVWVRGADGKPVKQ